MTLEPLHELSSASLRALAASLRGGALSAGLSHRALQQIVGPNESAVADCLTTMLNEGLEPKQAAITIEAILETRDHCADPATLFDLVMSGPDVYGYPTGDTAAAMLTLIQDARQEVLLVGYAVHNGRRLFEPLAERLSTVAGLRVRLCLNIPRPPTDTSLGSEIVRRYVENFWIKHWPWERRPELYYDPRALGESAPTRASLHAKCIAVDRAAALISSANFTEAAQERNIEVGVLTRYRPMAERLAGYFDSLCASGDLVRVPST